MKFLTAPVLVFGLISGAFVAEEVIRSHRSEVARVGPAYSGLAAFAAMSPKFPCEAWLRVEDRVAQPAMSVLWGTFGEDASCVAAFTERYRTRPHLIQIHPWNNTCWRNRNCQSGEIYPLASKEQINKFLENKDQFFLQTLADRLDNIRAVVENVKNENTVALLSFGLEDNYSDRAFAVLSDFVTARWPYGLIIRSGKSTPGILREAHGSRARCSGNTIVANEDGARPSARESQKFLVNNTGCYVTILWRSELQGRGTNGKYPKGVHPSQRNFVLSPKQEAETGNLLANYGTR